MKSRVDAILNEPQPAEHPSALINAGRAVLVKAGLRQPQRVSSEERAQYEQRVELYDQEVKAALDASREALQSGIHEGNEDRLVDDYLGIRAAKGETSLLPPLIRDLHAQAEQTAGHDIPFTKWMTDYATDKQLTNVWQWHDHYLNELDNAPEFKAQVERVKERHLLGTEIAIDRGELDERMRLSRDEIEAIAITHASPLSPITAFAEGRADLAGNSVVVRPGVADRVLTHEITHLQGIAPEIFNEGVTDRIAAAIYDNSHSSEDTYGAHDNKYGEQARMLDALEHLAEGKLDTYALSYVYGDEDNLQNKTLFMSHLIDKWAFNDIPLTIPMIVEASDLAAQYEGQYGHSAVVQVRQKMLANRISLFNELFFDTDGSKVAHTPKTLLSRLLSPETIASHTQYEIFDALGTVAEAVKLMGDTPSAQSQNPSASDVTVIPNDSV